LLSSLNVTGSGAIGGSLGVTGNVSFGSPSDDTTTFELYSPATFNSSASFNSGLSATSLSVSGDGTIGGNLTVDGVFTSSATSALATTTITGDFTVQDFGGSSTHLYVQNNTGNIGIGTTTPSVSLTIDDTDALLIPVGTDLQRPDGMTGLIRYNTDSTRFEGYANSSWTGLGGLIDIDQDTYVLAESSPGADEDVLFFYTSSTEKMRLTKTGNLGIGDINPSARLTASSTGEQLRLIYDEDNSKYASFTIDGNGDLNLDLASSNSTTTISDNLSVLGYLNVEGNATTTGSQYISKDLTIDGSSTFNNDINQTGNLSITGYASTTAGLFTLGEIRTASDLTSDGNLLVNANATTTGSLNVDGDFLTDGTGSFASANLTIDSSGNLTTTGYASTTAGLFTLGEIRTASTLTTDGNLLVNGNATTSGAYYIAKDLTVDGQCVTGDTLLPIVNDNIEYKQIKDVQPGDYVLSLNEKTGELTPAKIKQLKDMGVKIIYKIETEDGRTIRTTGNHPYLVSNIFPSISFNDSNQVVGFDNIKNNNIMQSDMETITSSMASKFFDMLMPNGMGQFDNFKKFVFNFVLNDNRQAQNLLFDFLVDDQLEHDGYALERDCLSLLKNLFHQPSHYWCRHQQQWSRIWNVL